MKRAYSESCYICLDPEFEQMGLPLCFACERCGAHIAADDGPDCPSCGYDHGIEPPTCSNCGVPGCAGRCG